MKRLAGLMLGFLLAVSAADVSVGAMGPDEAAAETDSLAGDPEADVDSDATDQALTEAQLLACDARVKERLAGEIGCAEQGHSTEIRFPPWG